MKINFIASSPKRPCLPSISICTTPYVVLSDIKLVAWAHEHGKKKKINTLNTTDIQQPDGIDTALRMYVNSHPPVSPSNLPATQHTNISNPAGKPRKVAGRVLNRERKTGSGIRVIRLPLKLSGRRLPTRSSGSRDEGGRCRQGAYIHTMLSYDP